jgi:hypothetical protein
MKIAGGTFASFVARLTATTSLLEEERSKEKRRKKRSERSPSIFDQRLH